LESKGNPNPNEPVKREKAVMKAKSTGSPGNFLRVHYLGNDTEVVFSSSLAGFAALKLFPTLLRLQYRHKKVGYFMVFQTPKVDFTVSFATSELATTIEKRYLTHVRPNTKSNKKQSTSNPQRNFLRGGAHGTHKRNLTLYFNKTPPNLIPSSSECFY
jgi:hypothetical protein